MNNVSLIGNISQAPELRYAPSGSAICSFSIAINRIFKREGEPEADFFEVTCFGKTAEYVAQNMAKGVKVGVTGRLQNDTWTDQATGGKRSKTKIIAENVEWAQKRDTTATDATQEALPQAAPSEAIQDDDDPFGE